MDEPQNPEWRCPTCRNIYSFIDGTRTLTHCDADGKPITGCSCPSMPPTIRAARKARDERRLVMWPEVDVEKYQLGVEIAGLKSGLDRKEHRLRILVHALRQIDQSAGPDTRKLIRDAMRESELEHCSEWELLLQIKYGIEDLKRQLGLPR